MKVKYPLLQVWWDDHTSNASWISEEDFTHTAGECVSCGWLYKEDDKAITLIGTLSVDPPQVGNTQYILKSCITKRIVIRKGTLEKPNV